MPLGCCLACKHKHSVGSSLQGLRMQFHAAYRVPRLWGCAGIRRHLSGAEGAFSVVLWLLDHGADVNPVDRFKRTPLEVRARPGCQGRRLVACVHACVAIMARPA